MFVRGHLKLIDFGIAKSFNSDTTNIYRESQIGTVNYMAPEAIAPMSEEESSCVRAKQLNRRQTNNNHSSTKASSISAAVDCNEEDEHHDAADDVGGGVNYKMRLGRASDVWSLGCILYQMAYGRPPFAALSTIQKLTSIPNPKFAISYPSGADVDAIESIQACLHRDPSMRAKIAGNDGLLSRAYLRVRPASGECTCCVSVSSSVGAVCRCGLRTTVQNDLNSSNSIDSDESTKALTANEIPQSTEANNRATISAKELSQVNVFVSVSLPP